MVEITAADLDRNLAALVTRAARGESFTITRHGAPVAKLVPPWDNVAAKPPPPDFAGIPEDEQPSTLRE